MKQLILQGFEVEIMGDKCNITYMFDPINVQFINGKKDKKSHSEQKKDGLSGHDQIEVYGEIVSLKVQTIEEFMQFMELMNKDNVPHL